MAKRKGSDIPSKPFSTPSKRSRLQNTEESDVDARAGNGLEDTPSKRVQQDEDLSVQQELSESHIGSSRQQNGTNLFSTPTSRKAAGTAANVRADHSAKRKSVQALNQVTEQTDWDNSAALARAILDETTIIESREHEALAQQSASAPVTPSKRGRGRPAGAKNKRSPTPEGDHPPEERYFFQNRMGPPRVSSNVFSTVGLLTHEEYFELMRGYHDHHDEEKAYTLRLHRRSFLQWKFELEEGFGVCLFGYGSKRKLVNNFAEWLYPQLESKPRVVVLNGYAPRINIRAFLHTIGTTLVAADQEMKLMGQPHDMVDTILAHLSRYAQGVLVIVVNSIDAAALRRVSTQAVLARMAAHPKVWLVATADTPTFPILWNSTLKNQFRFLYHDCTTFAQYDQETNPVDDVSELLGRKNKRLGGKEGIGFVLKSLPENARNLYRVLLTEILTIVNDGMDGGAEEEDAEDLGTRRNAGEIAEDVGIEYRALYQKALEEFICSSDMNFRFLLKEFYDHQMLTSKRDSAGVETLGVPLSRDEMETVLEDLVLG